MSAFKCKAEKEQGDGHIVLIDELQEANVFIFVGGNLKLRQCDNDYCFSRRGAQDLLLFLLEWYGEPEMLYQSLIGMAEKNNFKLYDGLRKLMFDRDQTPRDNFVSESAVKEFKQSEEYYGALEKEYQRGKDR